MSSLIDLHIHSTASDGSLTPFQIIALAQKSNVSAISITDHDTLDGVKELLQAARVQDPEWITGVEISCEPPVEFRHFGSIHLLGYGFSVYDRQLNAVLDAAQDARKKRNPKIIEKLNHLGIDIDLERVNQRFGADQVGRPHIAEYLKETGTVESFRQAFDLYLGKDRPAYVEKYKVSCKDAIKILTDAGGICVLAHPGLLPGKGPEELEAFVDMLISFGLEGMEVFYTDHDKTVTQYFYQMASEKKLLVTGGSDFHGAFNQGVALGTGKDNLNIDVSVFKVLKERLDDIRVNGTDISRLETSLGYAFENREILENALCHSSYLNENQDSCNTDNERLEFLGDAVLGLCIAHLLMESSPADNEGSLSKLRSNLVSEPALAQMARHVDLGRFIKLGKGEALSKGFDKNSILSDAFEAVIAAVFLDAGFNTVFSLVKDLFEKNVAAIQAGDHTGDHKSALQEYAQEKGSTVPRYELVKESGPDHDKTFEVQMELPGITSTGFGKTKKAAEQDSAQKALDTIRKQNN